MFAIRNILFFFLILCYLFGCKHNENAVRVKHLSYFPVTSTSKHVVKKNENLLLIAFQYSLSMQELARINKLEPPYLIYPGQKLFLSKKVETTKKSSNYSVIKPKKNIFVNKSAIEDKDKNIIWQWPVKGKVLKYFSLDKNLNKGIDIESNTDSLVSAAADGKIVYAGDDVFGYGYLLIIKHDGSFLSAYGYNKSLLIKEGINVKKGQKIAKSGIKDHLKPVLHFEIRKKGKPVDPLEFLPNM